MGKAKPPLVTTAAVHPFEKAFPTATAAVKFVAALVRVGVGLVRVVWPWRRELVVLAAIVATWYTAGLVLPTWSALLAALVVLALPLAMRRVRVGLRGWLRCSSVRRRLVAGMAQSRSANLDGVLPRVARIRPTPVGETVTLRLRAGHAAELLELRTELLRAALRARDVRVTRDPNRSHLARLDVIRRDSLATTGAIGWASQGDDVLSIWDPVHFGVSELGEAVWLSVVERAILVAGNRGAGKSNGLNVFLAHAAKSPDAHLLLIDANRVQFAPYRDRALACADHDPDAALGVVLQVQEELDRRLDWLMGLPGSPVALNRELSHTYGVPMWLLVIDELAYHTSVAGTAVQQKAFYNVLRDVVARGRAAGIVVIVATQRPTADLIPTSLRDLFDIRIAYRTMTTTASDVILGENFAKQGFSATDIDLDARGVNWLLASDADPIRTKTPWITPQTRMELGVTTVRHKPPTPVALVPAPRDPEGL